MKKPIKKIRKHQWKLRSHRDGHFKFILKASILRLKACKDSCAFEIYSPRATHQLSQDGNIVFTNTTLLQKNIHDANYILSLLFTPRYPFTMKLCLQLESKML